MKELSPEQLAKIAEPLPPEAITPHPRIAGLSAIKGIFVSERLNQVFGVGAWVVKTDLSSEITSAITVTNAGRERIEYTAIAKTIFTVPAHEIYYECIASSTNGDPGDAAKGATTDAITKIASWIGIGMDVYKGKHLTPITPTQPRAMRQEAPVAKKPATSTPAKQEAKADFEQRLGLQPTIDEVIETERLRENYRKLLQEYDSKGGRKPWPNSQDLTADRLTKGIEVLTSEIAAL